MNAYDFDKTIYHYDSSVRFYLWCVKRHPRIMRRWGKLMVDALFYKTKKINKHIFMERFYTYLKDVPNITAEVERFWDKNMCHMHTWYQNIHRPDDILLSASPLFLVKPAANRLGIVNVVGSPMNPDTCLYEGERCHGEGKVRYFRTLWGNTEIENFYSDSRSDTPMARIAKKAWLVHGERLHPWLF